MKSSFKTLFVLITALISCNALAVRKEITQCVGVIQGDCIIGNVTIGAANDKFSFNPQGIFVQNLSRIKDSASVELSLPLSGQKIIAFTPTTGKYADQQIKLLLYAFDLANMPKGVSNQKIYTEAEAAKAKDPAIKTMLKIYYQLPKEQQWTEMLTSFNEKQFATIKPSIKVDAQAKFTYYPQKYEDESGNSQIPEPIVFDLNNLS